MTSLQAKVWLSQETIAIVHKILWKTLANESLYQIKLKQFHWNVKWPHFSEYHELFEEMYTSLTEVIDDTAERIRALWIDCIWTMHSFINHSTLTENTELSIDATSMLMVLLQDEEHLIQELRKDIQICDELWDDGNTDFLIAIMQRHEKSAWMLRSTLS